MSQPPYEALSRSIKGKTALITGAASGMGRATAHLFAREGANVAVTDLKQDAVDAVVEEIKAAGVDHVKGWAMDVGDADMIKRVIDETAAHFGGLEILVNNAGFAIPANIAEESYEDSWGPSINVMLTSHQRAIRAALPYMRKAGYGRIDPSNPGTADQNIAAANDRKLQKLQHFRCQRSFFNQKFCGDGFFGKNPEGDTGASRGYRG